MTHFYATLLLSFGMLTGHLHAQSIFQGGIAGGDFSTQVSEFALPADLLYFTAERLPGGTTLTRWATSYEADLAYYAVETSADGKSFREQARQSAWNAYQGQAYELELPGADPSFFRLRVTESDGRAWYSAVVRTTADDMSWDFRPLGNPQRGDSPRLVMSGIPEGTPVTVRVVGVTGRLVHHGTYSLAGRRIDLPIQLEPATYAVSLYLPGRAARTQRLVVLR